MIHCTLQLLVTSLWVGKSANSTYQGMHKPWAHPLKGCAFSTSELSWARVQAQAERQFSISQKFPAAAAHNMHVCGYTHMCIFLERFYSAHRIHMGTVSSSATFAPNIRIQPQQGRPQLQITQMCSKWDECLDSKHLDLGGEAQGHRTQLVNKGPGNTLQSI